MSTYSSFLKKTFLFKNVEEEVIDVILRPIKVECKDYAKGDVIYSPDVFEKMIGFVIHGECLVSRQSGDSTVPLNTIRENDSFGITAVFSSRDSFPTVITAKSSCSILFLSEHSLRSIVKKNPQLSMNIIEFLTEKINFLNDKIAAFSGGSVEEKLASHILLLSKRNNSLEFDFNKKKSAEALNCGRASLYRAISALESAGYISLDNKKIIINDPEGLERI